MKINFSGISRQKAVGKLMRVPLSVIPKGTIIPVLQGHLRGKKWTVGAGPHGYWLGSYEYKKQNLFTSYLKPGMVAFDIGANLGFYTLLASDLVGLRGKVFSFEPVPRNFRLLKRHLRLNRIKNVTAIEAAVAEFCGEVTFQRESSGLGGRISTSNEQNTLRVQTVGLDELLEQGRVVAPQCLKIDVEGAEMSVLLGAKKMISDHKPILFIETHGEQVHKECCEFLRGVGYTLRALDDRPIEESDEIIAVYPSNS